LQRGNSTVELEIFEALTAANVPSEKAKAVAASIDQAIDRRYALHKEQLFTKADGAEMEARLLRAMTEMQRWTLTALFGALAALAVLIKFWP